MQRIRSIALPARGSVLVTAVDEPIVAAVKEEPSVVVGVKGPFVGASANEKEPSENSAVAACKELSGRRRGQGRAHCRRRLRYG